MIRIQNYDKYNPILCGIGILLTLQTLYPDDFRWQENYFIDKLFGSDYLRRFISQERNINSFEPIVQSDQLDFYEFRKPFLIYIDE